jgi:tetratricopeptide (TPR) repeat protein
MRWIFTLAILLTPLCAGEHPAGSPAAYRDAAATAARQGDWRSAEEQQRAALNACRQCAAAERAVLRGELAGYLTLGGFPEAAITTWKHSLAELPPTDPHYTFAQLGLGVAFHAAGRVAEAMAIWQRACPDVLEENTRLACRFNAAVNRIGTAPAWGELEEILPSLLALASPVNRTTALLQTARAAIAEGRFPRAGDLLDQAEAILDAELAARHPFRATLYEERASLAAAQGHRKVARQWQKKAASLSAGGGWERGSVSVDDLRKQSRR